MGEPPKYLMRFVGFKEDGSGELKPTSPAGYTDGQLLELPFDYSREPWWEIVDDIPDLEIPAEEAQDSVYETEDPAPLKYVLPIDQAPEDVYVIDYESMTVPTLKLFIKQRGGSVDRKWLKADLIREARKLEEASRAAIEPTKWWLISDEDVHAIRKGLTGDLLHTLSSGLHETEAVPTDFQTSTDAPAEEGKVFEGESAVIESHTGEPGVVVSVDIEPDEAGSEPEPSTEESAETDPLKLLVEKHDELAQRYHDGEITADQYRELSDKADEEHSESES